MGHGDVAAGEERIVVPGAAELGVVVGREEVEVADFGELRLREIGEREDPEARAVVRLEDEVGAHVEVVVDRRRSVGEIAVGAGEDEIVEIEGVEDVGARRRCRRSLVELVVQQDVALVVGEPGLVAVAGCCCSAGC